MRHGRAEALLAAGAALADLDPAEHAAYEEHRRTCAACRSLEQDLDRVVADLALAVPERTPPPDLLPGIRRALGLSAVPAGPHPVPFSGRPAAPGAVAAPTVAAPPREEPGTAGAPGRPASRRAPALLAAALALVAVGLGARTAALSGDLEAATARMGSLQAELDVQGALMAAAMDPAHVAVRLSPEPFAAGASAQVLYVPGTRDAWLVARGLPPCPEGHAYQLWYADDAGVHALGVYAWGGGGTFVAPFAVDLDAGTAAMLTLEPAGGATGSPGPQVVGGEL